MAQIVQTFPGDSALSLQNEEFVRKMAWGTNWTHVRLGFWLSINGNATINPPFPSLYTGLCQGTTNTYKSTTTTEWVGLRMGQGLQAWNYNAGPPAYYQTGNARIRIYRVGNTTTTAGSQISVTDYIPVGIRYLFMVDWLKTATGYQVGSYSSGIVPSGIGPWSREIDFLFSAHGEIGSTEYGAINFATNNLLDSVSIYWDYTTFAAEISSIVVVRVV